MDREEIIYSLNINDIYLVADQELNRNLSEDEISKISNKVGDYIDWYQVIKDAINDSLIKSNTADH